jgi:long-chain acyl-CoA synthetase
MSLLVQEVLENAAGRWPDKTALICGERQFTYRDLDEQANRVANGLVNLGVQRGDRVALMLGNSVEMIVAIFAVLKADAIFVSIHENTKPHRIDQILASARPTVMITRSEGGTLKACMDRRESVATGANADGKHFGVGAGGAAQVACGRNPTKGAGLDSLAPCPTESADTRHGERVGVRGDPASEVSLSVEASEAKAEGRRSEGSGQSSEVSGQKAEGEFCPGVLILVGDEGGAFSDNRFRVVRWETIQSEQPCTRPARLNIDLDLACLIYTSGTTGAPKGVMCGHSNMVFAIEAIAGYLENHANDRILSVLSLAYSYGLYQMLVTFHTGATLILEPSFAFPVLILQKMAAHRVTGFAGTPTIYALLLRFDLAPFDLTNLRYLTNAAAGLPVEHVRRVRAAFPQARFYSMHGLTEVVRTLYLPPDLTDQKPASVGVPMPGTEAWILDESGQRAGPETVGELVIRGRHVMRGYWRNPEATARRFRPGPIPGEQICHTGDLFKTDADGHFHFVSRSDDIIKCRGEKVAPREVENVLCQIPGVVEAAVVGVPDPILGQVVKAILVVDGLLVTRDDVLRHCKAQLEEHMRPRHVEFRSELPKNQSGKVLRTELG